MAFVFKKDGDVVADLDYLNTNKVSVNGNIGAATGTSLAVTGDIVTKAGTINYMGSAGGTADVLTATPTVALTAYTTGATYTVLATAANATTTPTINISGLGAKTIVKRASTALAASDIANGKPLQFFYNGTNMILLNPAAL